MIPLQGGKCARAFIAAHMLNPIIMIQYMCLLILPDKGTAAAAMGIAAAAGYISKGFSKASGGAVS